ncbi:MAG: T9SS type A sorting domain-containing protein, partial [Flavobacteriales bacterium]
NTCLMASTACSYSLATPLWRARSWSFSNEAYDIPALRGVWQEIRTPAARYAEALSLLDDGDFTNATAIVTAIPAEHDLKAPDFIERQRMLDLIDFLATVAGDGRDADELTEPEQDQLEALISGEQDRPATWAQNILCFHYGRCVAPWSGDGGEPKSLPKPCKESPATTQALSLHPNPTANWAVAKVRLISEDAAATLRVLDVTGKQVASYRLSGKEPQLVLDTRPLGAGAYLVELLSNGQKLASEKLIVQP